MRLSACEPRRKKKSVERHGSWEEGSALGRADRLESYRIALQEGENYQQEAAIRMKSGCTHDVLKCLPGQRCALEMRDGEGMGERRGSCDWMPRG